MSSSMILILEIIGTIAFSITGVLVAVEAKLDFFGVCFIGCITAVGGGVMRDVILGITPPLVFEDITMISIALFVSVAVFLLLYIKTDIYLYKTKIEQINNIFDAIGLGVFSVMGAEIACNYGYQDHLLLVVIAGSFTGIGGGMLRDVMTNNIPFVLKKYVYAVASLVGIIIFYFLKKETDSLPISSTCAVVLIVMIRLFATRYRWKLPKIDITQDI